MKKQPTMQDLRLLIERKRAESELRLFGSAAAAARSVRQRDDGTSAAPSKYFGTLAREPAPHDDVVAALRGQKPHQSS